MNKYEALGHYTELSETLDSLKKEREFLVSELARAAQRLENDLINEKGIMATPFNPEKNLTQIATSSKKIEEIQTQIQVTVEKINHYAKFCDKPQK